MVKESLTLNEREGDTDTHTHVHASTVTIGVFSGTLRKACGLKTVRLCSSVTPLKTIVTLSDDPRTLPAGKTDYATLRHPHFTTPLMHNMPEKALYH